MPRIAILATLASSGAAFAHPGHDAAAAQGTTHWLTTPSHWVVLALGAIVAAELARRAARHLRRALRDA